MLLSYNKAAESLNHKLASLADMWAIKLANVSACYAKAAKCVLKV